MSDSSLNEYLKEHIRVKDPAQKKVLDEALVFSGKKMEMRILERGLLSESDLAQLKADYFHLPFTSLAKLDIGESVHDLIPATMLRTYRMVPYSKTGNKVKLAIADPTNLQMLEALEFLAKKNNWDIELYLVTDTDLNILLQKSIGVAAEVKQALQEFTQTQATTKRAKAIPEQDFRIEEKAPVAKIVDGLIAQALSQRASDIHLEPLEDKSRVRFRVDGTLKEVITFPLNAHTALVARIKILADLKIDEQRLPQDGRFRFNWNNEVIDFRVSSFPTTYGEKIVLRALSRAQKIPTFEELGIVGQREKAVRKAIAGSHGMFLVTGPTGSGKSTTLFVALAQLNKPGVNIITLEDPVEYILPGVNQSQINPEIGFTFASGLRSILRQDPNVILIGEIRDRETAELAVHSALTGHLVFSTLHTNDAVGALPRLIDMSVEPFLIIASLNVIIAQRLVRTICNDCKTEVALTREVHDLILRELADIPAGELADIDLKKIKIYQGKGCKKCGDTGYQGRIGIFEGVEVTKEIGELTLAKAAPHKLKEVAQAQGMITLKQDGFLKVLRGITTLEEVLKETGR